MFITKVKSAIGQIRPTRLIGIAKLWFLLGIFLLPLVFWPWAAVPYEIPKVWFFQRWGEGLGILGVLVLLLPRLRSGFGGVRVANDRRNIWLVLLVGVFVLIAVLVSLLGVDFTKSFFGNYYRGDGLLTLFHLAGLFFFLVLFWEESWKESTVKAITAGSVLISTWTILLGILERLGILGQLGKYGGSFFGEAIGATFGNPNFLAGYLLVMLPFTIYELEDFRVLRVLGVAGQIAAIVLTRSRAGILGVFLLGVVFFWGKVGKWGKLGIIGIVGVLGIAGVLGMRKDLRVAEGMYFFPESRGRIIVRGIMAFTKRPLFGWGWANFDYAFESIDWPIRVDRDIYADKAHSGALEVLTTTGAVGFLIYTAVIILVFKGLLKDVKGKFWEKLGWEKALFLSFLLFLFHSQTNIISINEEMIFWLIAGITISSQDC